MSNKRSTNKQPSREEKLEMFVRDNCQFLPDPTYYFSVDDFVVIGNLKKARVVDVILDGLVYEIAHDIVDKNGYLTDTHTMFVRWLDIRPLNLSDDTTSLQSNSDLKLHYQNRTIDGLFSVYYKFGLNMNPPYQRGHVWTDEDKISLIKSVFSNVDIGKFVVVHLGYGGKYSYEILDGKQRLTALMEYYENRFPVMGKYYNELTRSDRYHFKDYIVHFAMIENATAEQKLRYFIMLNTGGVSVSEDHMFKVKRMLKMEQARKNG